MTQLTYRYQAIDRNGSRTRGSVRAECRDEACRQIISSGLKPLRITVEHARSLTFLPRRTKITVKDLAHLTYQLSVLLEARIPVAEALRTIAEQENLSRAGSNDRLRSIMEDMAQQIESGRSITDAIEPHRTVFGEVYVESIHAAEKSGNMIKVLARLAEMMERDYETSKNVKGALIYPICVLASLALAIVFLVVFVVPRFAGMFAARGIDLPLMTQMLIAASDAVRSYWFIGVCVIVGGWFLIRRCWRNPASRRVIDEWLHRIPWVSDVLRGLAISRFANVFGLCLQSGLGLIEAMEMSGKASGRPMLMNDVEKMRDQVNHGGRLSDVLNSCEYLPGFAKRMIAAGEEAAELPRMCAVVSRHYDREVQHLTKNVTTIIEPVMVIGLAAIVLIVALAIFLPMWDMAKLVG